MAMNRNWTVLLVAAAVLAGASPTWATHNPHLGRFMQRDPLGYPDGINGYEYCAGSGSSKTDPSGTEVEYAKGEMRMFPQGGRDVDTRMEWDITVLERKVYEEATEYSPTCPKWKGMKPLEPKYGLPVPPAQEEKVVWRNETWHPIWGKKVGVPIKEQAYATAWREGPWTSRGDGTYFRKQSDAILTYEHAAQEGWMEIYRHIEEYRYCFYCEEAGLRVKRKMPVHVRKQVIWERSIRRVDIYRAYVQDYIAVKRPKDTKESQEMAKRRHGTYGENPYGGLIPR